jgi:hypothetical protein
VEELISIDEMLCPNLIENLVDEDWDYNVHEDNRVYWFRDFNYLMRRVGFDTDLHNILAIADMPEMVTPYSQFVHRGFDVIDSYDNISILTNCRGGFGDTMKGVKLNHFGLIDSLATAESIADTLRRSFSEDAHCKDCRSISLAQYVEDRPHAPKPT